MGPKSQSSPSHQSLLKQKATRPISNPYSKENEIKRKADQEVNQEARKF
jgi:hypothetical protein